MSSRHGRDQRISPGTSSAPRFSRRNSLFLAAGAYLLLSVVVWWNVWSSDPKVTTTCGCGDNSFYAWFLEWPVYAFSHGLNPFYSTSMGFPHGVNLLANTSQLALGVALAPITWAFGSVASLNVALTLSPMLSALAMFVLLRRWVSWMPAAFAGGLIYGFSPFVLNNLTSSWLNLGMAAIPPLIVVCLDELLVRQRWRPIVTGLLLGLLLAVQFFIGTEILVLTVITAAIGVILVVAYAALRYPLVLRANARYAAVALGAAAITTLLLLAYPAWFAVDGPAHFGSLIWGASLSSVGTTPKAFVVSTKPGYLASAFGNTAFGYLGPIPSEQYFGFGLAAVLIGGFAAWRRDRRLWLFGAMFVITIVLSLGVKNYPSPWALFAKLTFLDNIEPSRFVLFSYLAAAVMLGIIVDRTYLAVNRRRVQHGERAESDQSSSTQPIGSRPWSGNPPWLAPVAGLVVAAIALAPLAAYLAPTVPFVTQRVAVPTWFRTVSPHLQGNQVVLILPYRDASEVPMTWQIAEGIHFSMVNEGGPGGALKAGRDREAASILGSLSIPGSSPLTLTAGDVAAVRESLVNWGVTMVVIPDQPNLPVYDQIQSVTAAATLITAATGKTPIHQAQAWVWKNVDQSFPSTLPTDARMSQCTAGASPSGVSAVDQATACVLDA
jgi:hypothetical protein